MARKSWIVVLLVSLALLLPGLVTSASAGSLGPPVSQTAPTVTGPLRVGGLLSTTTGAWDPTPASYQYSWLRDDVAIPGAHASSYRLTGADRGHQLASVVTAYGSDETPGAPAVSVSTAVIGWGQFAAAERPTITGARRWGHTLTVDPGTWSPKPTTVSYQWERNGVAIKGATGARYTATLADFGKHLRVRAVARRADYANGVVYSPATGPIGHRVAVKKRFTYSIATRGKITANLAKFAELAAATYADPRGWRAAGYEFRQVKRGGDFTLVLSAAGSVPSFGSPCSSTWSCRVGRYVIINQTRWVHASPAWNAQHQPLRDYRHMVVNHETGHWLGHHHLSCPGKGRLAPIMMQQSKGLNGCRFNPFPLPGERWSRR